MAPCVGHRTSTFSRRRGGPQWGGGLMPRAAAAPPPQPCYEAPAASGPIRRTLRRALLPQPAAAAPARPQTLKPRQRAGLQQSAPQLAPRRRVQPPPRPPRRLQSPGSTGAVRARARAGACQPRQRASGGWRPSADAPLGPMGRVPPPTCLQSQVSPARFSQSSIPSCSQAAYAVTFGIQVAAQSFFPRRAPAARFLSAAAAHAEGLTLWVTKLCAAALITAICT